MSTHTIWRRQSYTVAPDLPSDPSLPELPARRHDQGINTPIGVSLVDWAVAQRLRVIMSAKRADERGRSHFTVASLRGQCAAGLVARRI